MGKYLYCIIPCPEKREFGSIGIGDAKVFTVNYNKLAFVVSNSQVKNYYPTRKNALAHEKVIATVMQDFAVVPMSFGLVCNNEHQVINILKENYAVFQQKLAFLTGKIEVGLKIWWEKDNFHSEIFGSEPRLSTLKQEIEAQPEHETYFATVEFGKLVEQVADELRKKYEKLIFQPLQEIAIEGKVNKLAGELMVLNAAFLVDKQKEREFDSRVNDFFLIYRDKMMFKYSGPWPPYNFVDIRLNKKF